MTLILTSRFMGYFPDPAASSETEDALRVERAARSAGLAVLRKAPFLFACETGRPETPLQGGSVDESAFSKGVPRFLCYCSPPRLMHAL